MLNITSPKAVERLCVVDSSSKGSHFHSKFIGILDSQVTKTSNSDNSTSSSRFHISFKGCVNGDACTEKRGNLMKSVV